MKTYFTPRCDVTAPLPEAFVVIQNRLLNLMKLLGKDVLFVASPARQANSRSIASHAPLISQNHPTDDRMTVEAFFDFNHSNVEILL